MYSPAFPLIFQQYAELLTSEDRHGKGASAAEQRVGPRENEAREINTKIASDVRPQRQNTLLESAHDVGGISVFIYLFAKVVFFMRSSLGQKERSGCWENVFAPSEPYIICVCFSQLLFQALLNHVRGIKVS